MSACAKPTTRRSGTTLRKMGSPLRPKTLISASGVFFWDIRRRSSGCGWEIARPMLLLSFCAAGLRISKSSCRMSRNRLWPSRDREVLVKRAARTCRFVREGPQARRISDSLRRQERVAARALALSHTEQHVRRNHGYVGKLAELRDARVRRALVPVASRIHLPSCGRLAMISWIAQEANGDSELDPHGQPARHKALGAILRSESSTRQRVFDPDVLAHDYRQAGDGVARMPANCDSGARVCFERARLPLGERSASVLLSGISARSQLSRVRSWLRMTHFAISESAESSTRSSGGRSSTTVVQTMFKSTSK